MLMRDAATKRTRKKFIHEELPNNSETEDMRKIRWIFPNFTVKYLEQFQHNYRIRNILL